MKNVSGPHLKLLHESSMGGMREGRVDGGREVGRGVWGRIEDGEDESRRLCIIRSHTHSLFLSAPLQLPSQCTPTHFPHLLRHCRLLTCSNQTHTHTLKVPDERTPTSMAGLWKRVCRRDKSIMQHMPAYNNPTYTHSVQTYRLHDMDRHIEEMQYRTWQDWQIENGL